MRWADPVLVFAALFGQRRIWFRNGTQHAN
jgi:hypothetical protein